MLEICMEVAMALSIKLVLAAILATGCYATVGVPETLYGYNEYGDPIYYVDGAYLVLSDGYWYSIGPYGYVPYGHHHAYRSHRYYYDHPQHAYRPYYYDHRGYWR